MGEFNTMLVLFAKFIGSLLRSLFVSILMVVIVYSVITGEFPPSLSKAKTTWNNLIQLSQLRENTVHNLDDKRQQTAGEVDEEWDVNALETFNTERSKLARGLLSDQKKIGYDEFLQSSQSRSNSPHSRARSSALQTSTKSFRTRSQNR